MGNCQASEAATVVIQHPSSGGSCKVERIYWSVSAHEVMNSNPGHYVALIMTSTKTQNGISVKQLKLLKPDDTLLLGHVYRLISFQDVLKEFAAKKCVKLGKLLKQSGGLTLDLLPNKKLNANSTKNEQEDYQNTSSSSSNGSGSTGNRGMGRHHGGGQWKPALQSIAELEN